MDPTKGTRNPQESDFEGLLQPFWLQGFIRFKETETPLLEGHSQKNLYTPGEKGSVTPQESETDLSASTGGLHSQTSVDCGSLPRDKGPGSSILGGTNWYGVPPGGCHL